MYKTLIMNCFKYYIFIPTGNWEKFREKLPASRFKIDLKVNLNL